MLSPLTVEVKPGDEEPPEGTGKSLDVEGEKRKS